MENQKSRLNTSIKEANKRLAFIKTVIIRKNNRISRKQAAILSNMTVTMYKRQNDLFKKHKSCLDKYLKIKVFPKIDTLSLIECCFIEDQLNKSGYKISYEELSNLFRREFDKKIPGQITIKRRFFGYRSSLRLYEKLLQIKIVVPDNIMRIQKIDI